MNELRKKIQDTKIMFEGQIGSLKYDEMCESPEKLEQIADNYALEFAEWVLDCQISELTLQYFKDNVYGKE